MDTTGRLRSSEKLRLAKNSELSQMTNPENNLLSSREVVLDRADFSDQQFLLPKKETSVGHVEHPRGALSWETVRFDAPVARNGHVPNLRFHPLNVSPSYRHARTGDGGNGLRLYQELS
jgi:hypothetical protein